MLGIRPTQEAALFGTNFTVTFGYVVKENHLHSNKTPGIYELTPDQPHHNDLQSDRFDSFEIVFDTGSLGHALGQPLPNGLQFDSRGAVREYERFLRIEGADQSVFEQSVLGGFFVEVQKIEEGDGMVV